MVKACWAHIGIDLRSRKTFSRGFFAIRSALSTVLMVLTWHSMKPLDLGKWWEDVECPMW